MCGIVGIMLKPNLSEAQVSNVQYRMGTLLRCAQVRGTDAAGVMIVQPDGIEVLKAEGPAFRLVSSSDWRESMAGVTPDTIAVIGHTRAATQGGPENNLNNHPVTDEQITLVHNGWIMNDAELDEKYFAQAEVDTASLAAAVRSLSYDDGLDEDNLEDACLEAVGKIATVAVDSRNPEGVYAYRDTNPLVGKVGASGYWFGSTGDILRRAGVTLHTCAPVPAYQGLRLTPNGPETTGGFDDNGWERVVDTDYLDIMAEIERMKDREYQTVMSGLKA